MGQKEVGFTYFKDDQSAWEITDVNKDIFNKLKRYLLYIIKNYLITYQGIILPHEHSLLEEHELEDEDEEDDYLD